MRFNTTQKLNIYLVVFGLFSLLPMTASAAGGRVPFGAAPPPAEKPMDAPKTPPGFGAEDLPKGYEMTNPKQTPEAGGYEQKSFFRTAIGGGLGFPDLLPIEGYVFFGRYFGLRAFYSLPVPFKVKADVSGTSATAQNGAQITTGDVTTNFDAIYGPHYGIDALVLPFGGSFYIALGLSHRHVRVEGSGDLPVYVCSAGTTNCTADSPSVVNKSTLGIEGDVTTDSLMLRSAAGWFWELGDDFYFNTQLGLARPFGVERNISLTTSIRSSQNTTGEDLSTTVAEAQGQKQKQLEDKVADAMEPYDSKVVPIVTFAFGLRF